MGGRGYGSGGRGRVYIYIYTYRYTVTTRMTCIKMGSDESHFNVSLIVRDKVTMYLIYGSIRCVHSLYIYIILHFERTVQPRLRRVHIVYYAIVIRLYSETRESTAKPCLSAYCTLNAQLNPAFVVSLSYIYI